MSPGAALSAGILTLGALTQHLLAPPTLLSTLPGLALRGLPRTAAVPTWQTGKHPERLPQGQDWYVNMVPTPALYHPVPAACNGHPT